MGDGRVIERPVWRTPLAVAIAAWIGLAISMTLGAARLMEVTPEGLAPVLLAAIFVVPPPLLIVWSFWAMMRDPLTGWLAPAALMAFCGAFVPMVSPLYETGVRINFEARRPTYEAIVADAKAGRIVGVANARGWVEGERGEVKFRYRPADPGVIDFVWVRAYGVRAGVFHDDTPCVAKPGYSCIDRGEPLDGPFAYYQRLF